MPKQGWIAFTDTHPDGYVVVASVLCNGRLMIDKARVESLRALLVSLIEKLAPGSLCHHDRAAGWDTGNLLRIRGAG